MAAATSLATQISNHLAAKSLHANPAWLNSFLSSQRPTTPLPALKQTALFRLLASDITKSLQRLPTSTFPADILNAEIKERKLSNAIPVQVIDVEDVGRSRWSQIEAIESEERGETTKGRETIRVVPGEQGLSDPSEGSSGPHKLLVQDAAGVRMYCFELNTVEGVGLAMGIGSKLLLRNVTVARAVVLLAPESVTVLGGKIDAWQKAWKDGRKEALSAIVHAARENGT